MTHKIIETGISEGISYGEYIELVNRLVIEGSTTGAEATKQRIDLTKLNASRMRRLDKTLVIPRQAVQIFERMQEKQTWLVLSESWCADAAQTIPVLNKIAQEMPAIDLKILFRDDNLGLMDHFLTKGTRSIPKLVIIDNEGTVLHTWGPRSKVATSLVDAYRSQNSVIDDDFKKSLQIWYNKDKGEAIIKDVVKLIGSSMPTEFDFGSHP